MADVVNKIVESGQRANQRNDVGIALRTGLDPTGADQCQILANQISGFGLAGIAIFFPARDLIVKLNIVEQCGSGIISAEDASSDSVSIENNVVNDIGGVGDAPAFGVVGIGVARAAAATISGNTLRRIGQADVSAPLCAGILAASVQRLRASGNDVVDVAPPVDFVGVAAGLMLRAPYSLAEVTLNYIARDGQASSQVSRSQWYAVLVDQPMGDRTVSRLGTYAAVKIDDARTLVFGAKRPYVVAAQSLSDAAGAVVVRGASASVLGNTLIARGATPAVDVVAPGDCLFNDNRCELRSAADAPAVRLAAGATIVNANRVLSGQIAIQLLGNTKRVTVVGNITTGVILAGGALPAPWDTLNVLG